MTEPQKYVVPTDMLTGEWAGMRVYGDTTRVVTLADALDWVQAEREATRVEALEYQRARDYVTLWQRLMLEDRKHRAALARAAIVIRQRLTDSDVFRLTGQLVRLHEWETVKPLPADKAAAPRTLTADDPEPAVGSVVLDRIGDPWRAFIGVGGVQVWASAGDIRSASWANVHRLVGPVTLIHDGAGIDAAPQDESRGHRVFTGAQSVTFDGKPNDPYRPATSAEADAIDAQAAEFLRPLIDSGAIVQSGHARTCGIWRITAAVARCTCKPAATKEVS